MERVTTGKQRLIKTFSQAVNNDLTLEKGIQVYRKRSKNRNGRSGLEQKYKGLGWGQRLWLKQGKTEVQGLSESRCR